jgi:hypothetical protein
MEALRAGVSGFNQHPKSNIQNPSYFLSAASEATV